VTNSPTAGWILATARFSQAVADYTPERRYATRAKKSLITRE
jgi:hypothetical protein